MKDVHSYNFFTDGFRYILIRNGLYIIGGKYKYDSPVIKVLYINTNYLKTKKLQNLNESYTYHSIEYFDNYDYILIIGGTEKSEC